MHASVSSAFNDYAYHPPYSATLRTARLVLPVGAGFSSEVGSSQHSHQKASLSRDTNCLTGQVERFSKTGIVCSWNDMQSIL
jgi:hypothetical protein